jgi:hypothetical protein
MARSFQLDAALLAMSRSTIAESRRLLAASWSERVSLNNNHDVLLANSRASIADSRRLKAAVEAATAATHRDEACRESIAMPTPVTARARTDSAALSIHVFQERSRFSWTVCSPSEEMLGRGTAETEVKARADAFCAGMIYLDGFNDRSPSGDASLH